MDGKDSDGWSILAERLRAAGLDPEPLREKILDFASTFPMSVKRIVDALIRVKQAADRQRLESAELTAMLRQSEPILLRNRPSYDLKVPWTPPPRRASKRAQRQRERPWSR
jgi:hypothetical protein